MNIYYIYIYMGMSLSFFTLMTNDKDMFKPNTEIKQSEHNSVDKV